jgi:hypothetical protein
LTKHRASTLYPLSANFLIQPTGQQSATYQVVHRRWVFHEKHHDDNTWKPSPHNRTESEHRKDDGAPPRLQLQLAWSEKFHGFVRSPLRHVQSYPAESTRIVIVCSRLFQASEKLFRVAADTPFTGHAQQSQFILGSLTTSFRPLAEPIDHLLFRAGTIFSLGKVFSRIFHHLHLDCFTVTERARASCPRPHAFGTLANGRGLVIQAKGGNEAALLSL